METIKEIFSMILRVIAFLILGAIGLFLIYGFLGEILSIIQVFIEYSDVLLLFVGIPMILIILICLFIHCSK